MASGVRPGLWRAESTRVDVERNRPRSMSSGVGPVWCQGESAWVDVEGNRPGSMSSGVGPGRCRAESTIDPGQLRSTTTRADSGNRLRPTLVYFGPRRRGESTLVDFERSLPRSMLSRVDPSRCRSVSARVDVKLCRPELRSICHRTHVESSRPRPRSSRIWLMYNRVG